LEREEKRQKMLEREETLRQQRKKEEHDRWWSGAEIYFPKGNNQEKEEEEEEEEETKKSSLRENIKYLRTMKLQRYTADYSKWDRWTPTDDVSQQEILEKQQEEEKRMNDLFEKNNPEFCSQVVEDMQQRKKKESQKQQTANELRLKGNQYFKKKEYNQAIDSYQTALKECPFDTKLLLNIAQSYLKLKDYENAYEFLLRTLYLDEYNIKALSRKAFLFTEWHRTQEALICMNIALSIEPNNEELIIQHREITIMENEKQAEQFVEQLKQQKLNQQLQSQQQQSAVSSFPSEQSTITTSNGSIPGTMLPIAILETETAIVAYVDSLSASLSLLLSNTIIAEDLLTPFEIQSTHTNPHRHEQYDPLLLIIHSLYATYLHYSSTNRSSTMKTFIRATYRSTTTTITSNNNSNKNTFQQLCQLLKLWYPFYLQSIRSLPTSSSVTTTTNATTITTSYIILLYESFLQLINQSLQEDRSSKQLFIEEKMYSTVIKDFVHVCYQDINNHTSNNSNHDFRCFHRCYLLLTIIITCIEDDSNHKMRLIIWKDRSCLMLLAHLFGSLNTIITDHNNNNNNNNMLQSIQPILQLYFKFYRILFFSSAGKQNIEEFYTEDLEQEQQQQNSAKKGGNKQQSSSSSPSATSLCLVMLCAVGSFLSHHTLLASIPSIIINQFNAVNEEEDNNNHNNHDQSNENQMITNVLEEMIVILLGASQLEQLRTIFTIPLPSHQKTVNRPTTTTSEQDTEKTMIDSLVELICIYPIHTNNILAILLNITAMTTNQSYVTTEELEKLRNSVMNTNIIHEAFKIMMINNNNNNPLFDTEEDFVLMRSRYAGLISRLVTMKSVQEMMLLSLETANKQQQQQQQKKKKMMNHIEYYQLLIQRFVHLTNTIPIVLPTTPPTTSSINNKCMKWQHDELQHHLRSLAAININHFLISSSLEMKLKFMKLIKETHFFKSILSLFPEPKKELGEITRHSIVLIPNVSDQLPSSQIIGNAARCLLYFADDLQTAEELFINHQLQLLTIEKLICAMATVTDIRVRRNISIVLAKGIKALPQSNLRQRIQDYRGLEMMIQLQKEL
jgi:tetratricopeptide (TPR) repeat protein